jgi:serine/threonine-protein kinase
MLNKTIVGRYLLQEELGAGGMGKVYQGFDNLNQQTVAVKQLHANLTDKQMIERFKREGEALRELNYPNIVKMLDTVEEDGNHYLIMEYISGADLSEHIKDGQMPLEKILNISIVSYLRRYC